PKRAALAHADEAASMKALHDLARAPVLELDPHVDVELASSRVAEHLVDPLADHAGPETPVHRLDDRAHVLADSPYVEATVDDHRKPRKSSRPDQNRDGVTGLA